MEDFHQYFDENILLNENRTEYGFFRYIDKHDNEELKEFVPLLGDRLKLKKSIENHIIRENSINIGDSVEEIDSDILIDSLPGTSGASSDSTFSSSKSTISDRSITIESALKVADFDSVAKLDILEILNENIIGKAVVLKANKSLPLNSKDRNTICEIIVTHFLNRGLKLNNVYLSILSDKITLAFPSEKRSSYYISPIPKRQSLRNKPEIARGKLIDKHRNKLSAIRKSLNLGNESDPTEAKGLPDIPNQVRDSKLLLRNNIEPEDEVIAAWNSSYCLRSDNKTPTIKEYFSEWPILRTQMAPKLRKMSTVKCNYTGCSKNISTEITTTFFRFPVKDKDRCQKWIFHSGNIELLDMSEKQLINRRICQDHFDDSAFTNDTHKRLIKTAIPIHFEERQDTLVRTVAEIKTYSPANKKRKIEHPDASSGEESLTSPLETKFLLNAPLLEEKDKRPALKENMKKRKNERLMIKLQRENKQLRKLLTKKNEKLRICQQHLRRLKSKISGLSENSVLKKAFEDLYPSVKTLMYMQMRHRSKSKWSNTERRIALSMFYKSPSLYNYLLDKLKMNLPAVNTLRRWIRVINLRTGFKTGFLRKLRHKVDLMEPFEKECVVMMDEMSLKKSLDYDERLDILEGFQDYAEEGGRCPKKASHAVVFMARGLFRNWSTPLAYYLSSGPITARQLKKCLEICLVEVEKLGLITNVVVCDQGSNNRSVFNMFGVTKDKPYFMFNEKKMFALYDAPHLIKNVRNSLLKRDIKVGENYVSWRDIKQTYEIDSKNTLSHTLLKITDKHINPNSFQKMNVKLATQIFSRTFHSAMVTVISTGELKSATAKATAKFVLRLNDIFDCLNSQGKFKGNYLRRPLSDTNEAALQTLKDSIEFIESWSVEKNTPYCFDGLVQTINGILQLWDDKKSKFPYLITSRLNQDPIENLFSKIRQRRGYDPNPSARHFRFGLQSVMTGYLEKYSEKSNCQDDGDYDLCSIEQHSENIDSIVEEKTDIDIDGIPSPSESGSTSFESIESDGLYEHKTLESNSITYFAGYLVKKINKKYNCDDCEKNLLHDKNDIVGDRAIYVLQRDFGISENVSYLKIPNDNFTNIIRRSLMVIEKFLNKRPHSLRIKYRILTKICRKKNIKNWLADGNSICEGHRNDILNLLVRVKLLKIINPKDSNKKETKLTNKNLLNVEK